LLISTLGVGVTACGKGADASGSASGWPAGRQFQSTRVTDAGRDRPLVAGTRIELRFFEDGRLSAQAGCNHIGGDGRIDGDRLVLGELSMTEMGCDEPRHSQDEWLADFLGAKPTWSLSGTDLVLGDGDVEVRLVDAKVADPDRSLVGTRWVLDPIVTGEVASSVPSGVEAYVRFDSETSFVGSSGCLAFAGTSQIRGGRINFFTHRPSPRSCTAEMRAADAAVTRTLVQDVGYRIDGPLLTLTAPDGSGLRFRAMS